MSEHHQILDVIWFSNRDGSIGIVATRDEMGKWKAYIGVGNGFNERADREHIAAWGAQVDEHIARACFPRIEGEYRE